MSAATLEKEESELLDAHKAALRRVASKPQLVTQMSGGPNGRTDYRPKTLSLVKPQLVGGARKKEGIEKEMEETKKFKAFQGSGHVMLSPEQVKNSSPSEMHKLAVARLARMQRSMNAVSKSDDTQTQGEKEQTVSEEEKEEEERLAYEQSHQTQAPIMMQATKPPVVQASRQIPWSEDFGSKEGIDVNGNAWQETWGLDEDGNMFGSKTGYDHAGQWSETWTQTKSGDFELSGYNAEGHAWTEKFGTYENGTTWKEKSLTKDQFWVETNGWDSEGRIWGVRQGLTGDGKGWTEEWAQVMEDGVTKGSLKGTNEHNESWAEEWETTPLNAFDAETGEQKMSMCGQKSGVDRAGTSWKEAWGKDDVYGRWGMREETEVDGSTATEHWGSNTRGDVWCSKWGVKQHPLGVSEEWGFSCGQKNLQIGQEMDGVTNYDEGKTETWTESWSKIFEADGRLARTHAEKEGDNGFGDRWVEKWDELYEKSGATNKWASKKGAKERTNDEWTEEWGEKRGAPDEYNEHGKFLSCWAEKKGTNGFGEVWHDQWSENYEEYGMGGNKVCNKWRRRSDGVDVVERSGEEWDGKGWFQKGGETVVGADRVDGWHERAW